MERAFSDYYAISIQNYYRRKAHRATPEEPTEPVDGAGLVAEAVPDNDELGVDPQDWVYAGWLTDIPTGLRSASYHEYPHKYGQLKKSKMTAHRAGEVWCAALLEMNRALGEGDLDQGDERGWQLVFDSLTFLHAGGNGPTFIHARDAVFCAYKALVASGKMPSSPGLRSAVCKVFQDRGLGGNAKSTDAKFKSAKENDDPNRPGQDGPRGRMPQVPRGGPW